MMGLIGVRFPVVPWQRLGRPLQEQPMTSNKIAGPRPAINREELPACCRPPKNSETQIRDKNGEPIIHLKVEGGQLVLNPEYH